MLIPNNHDNLLKVKGKYYYGNSYKEAISNPPVEIKTVKQLREYEAQYVFVFPKSWEEK